MKSNLQWLLSVGNNFFRVIPGTVLLSIVLTLMSKFTFLLASFLPLKVIILLGSEHIPSYFPDSFHEYGRDALIMSLTFAAVSLYLVYLSIEKMLGMLTKRGGKELLLHSRKILLFDNQDLISEKAFSRYSESLAHLLFIVLTFGALLSFYPSVAFLLIAYGLLSILLLGVLVNWLYPQLANQLEDDPAAIVSIITNIGFLLSFIYIVYQSIYGFGPSILLAIISLLLIRQSLANLKNVANNIRVLTSQRVRINALFFHEKLLVSEKKPDDELFWALAEQSRAEAWAGIVITQLYGERPKQLSLNWFQMEVQDVLAFRVTIHREKSQDEEFLVKLFGKKQNLIAQQESEILTQLPTLPSLNLLLVGEVEGFQCLLFEWQDGAQPTMAEVRGAKLELTKSIMSVPPPLLLMEKYQRSHPLLPQRLDRQFWSRVRHVNNVKHDENFNAINLLLDNIDRINEQLSSLPLTVINTAFSQHMLLQLKSNSTVLLHWPGWAIEPVGADWSTNLSELDKLSDVVDAIGMVRSDVQHVRVLDVRLCALMYAFEKLIKRCQFFQAFELVIDVLQCFEVNVTDTIVTE